MNKRGLLIFASGLILTGVSLFISTSLISSNVTGSGDLPISILFDGLFDKISDETLVLSGDSFFVSYDVSSSLLWGIQILDYQSGDKLSVSISNIFGDDYGKFTQNEPILFELLDLSQSDTLNFEIKNIGTKDIYLVYLFSEDPGNSNVLSDPTSPTMDIVYQLAFSGLLLLAGIIVLIIGLVVLLFDLKNSQNTKKHF